MFNNNKAVLDHLLHTTLLELRAWNKQDRQGLWIMALLSDGGGQQGIRTSQMVAIMNEINRVTCDRK